jgi:small-conductance mechanosensitive channel
MAAKQKKETEKEKNLRETAVSEMIRLMTASFGLIAALAWNQLMQEIVSTYIKPVFGKNSGIISLFIYALIITILAVIVTYFLAKFVKKE